MKVIKENYIVTLESDGHTDHLRAVSNDGVHGKHNCSFPKSPLGYNRTDWNNEGMQFEVKDLVWTGSYYRVNAKDPNAIVRVVHDPNALNRTQPVTQATIPSVDKSAQNSEDDQKFSTVNTGWRRKAATESLKEGANNLNRYEVYDINDKLLNTFEAEEDAMQWAMEHSDIAEYIDLSSADSADFERIWENNGEEYAQCWACGEWFEKSDLLRTDPDEEEYICQNCFDAYRSHGEPLSIFYNYR